MPIRDYPFSITDRYNAPAPLLPIRLTNPANDFVYDTWGLIDTGADGICIPGHISRALYHDNDGVKASAGTGAGGIFLTYPHTFKIEFFGMDEKGDIDTNDIVHIIDDRLFEVAPDLHLVIIGVDNFLENFKLTIDYPNKTLSVMKRRKWITD
jgi:hypothetical protein